MKERGSMKRRRMFGLLALVVVLFAGACGAWLHVQQRQYALNRQLIAALEHNDTKTALALVNAGADPNTRYIPLPAPSLQLLIKQRLLSTPSSGNNSPTALMFASGIRWKPPGDRSASLLIVEENRSLLRAMLTHSANVHARTQHNLTTLHYAALMGRLYTVERLLQYGSDINAIDDRGDTPLMLAASTDAVDVVHLLLTHGTNPNVQNEGGDTALYYTLFSPNAESLISELLAHGANPTMPNNAGDTPLQYARMKHRPDLVRLLKRGAK